MCFHPPHPPTSGCAICCYSPPTPEYPDTCVYADQHVVVAYSTPDFEVWTPLGTVLPLSARVPGIEFRPQVVYCAATGLFVMWYEDRWDGQRGMGVATSRSPAGPFTTISNSTLLPGAGRVGDYDLFVEGGKAYHVRTGLTIAPLDASFTVPTGASVTISNGGVEGPAMFRRGAIYYLLVGPGCCACRGGSDIVVYTAPAPMGPWTLTPGSVGRNTSQPFDAHSPLNYATHAQQTKVIEVPDGRGNTQYLWLGNQWVSEVGQPRNQNLLYWAVLEFDAQGAIQQLSWSDTTTITVA